MQQLTAKKVETAYFVFFAIFWGINPIEILSISSADTISAKLCFPYTEERSFMVSGTSWWFEVVLVLFLIIGISPVTQPLPKFL